MTADFSLSALASGAPGEAAAVARPAASRRLRDLLRGVAEVAAADDVTVTGLCLDSRAVQPGDLFCALPGGRFDGRDFIAQAIQRGASAVAREAGGGREKPTVPCIDIADLGQRLGGIASRFYGDPSARLRVIGITGTNGKTTSAYLTAQALSGGGEKCALLSTVGGGIIGDGARARLTERGRDGDGGGGRDGDGDELRPAGLTTADAIATQLALADFHARGAVAACVEASSHGLAQGRLGGVDFDLALLTNLSRDHLDYHADMDAYRAAKRRLFEGDGLGCAVINLDDDFGRELLGQHRAAECLTYAIADAAADLCARDIESSVDGIAFEADFRGEMARVCAPLIGRVNAPNILAAIAAGLGCGHDLGALAAAARRWRGPPGRMELLPRAAGRPAVLIDYAHTPDALARALDSAAALCAGRLHLVFGCGGDRDAGKRPQMGQVAARAGRVIVTDDNPRFEDPAHITADIIAGMAAAPIVIHDRRAAIETALADAGADDIVLIAGKGHERAQTVADRAVEFSDRAVALEALR